MHTASFLKQQSVQFSAEQNRGDCPPWCSHLHTDEGGLPAGKKRWNFYCNPIGSMPWWVLPSPLFIISFCL
jgi:hypothetical protein